MLSLGSPKLMYATKRGPTLSNVGMDSLSRVARNALVGVNASSLENRIL